MLHSLLVVSLSEHQLCHQLQDTIMSLTHTLPILVFSLFLSGTRSIYHAIECMHSVSKLTMQASLCCGSALSTVEHSSRLSSCSPLASRASDRASRAVRSASQCSRASLQYCSPVWRMVYTKERARKRRFSEWLVCLFLQLLAKTLSIYSHS